MQPLKHVKQVKANKLYNVSVVVAVFNLHIYHQNPRKFCLVVSQDVLEIAITT